MKLFQSVLLVGLVEESVLARRRRPTLAHSGIAYRANANAGRRSRHLARLQQGG